MRNYSSPDIEEKWEGRTPFYNIGNRLAGAGMAFFGSSIMLTCNIDSTPFNLAGWFLFAEGVGDLLSGKHHYISSRTIFYRYLNTE